MTPFPEIQSDAINAAKMKNNCRGGRQVSAAVSPLQQEAAAAALRGSSL